MKKTFLSIVVALAAFGLVPSRAESAHAAHQDAAHLADAPPNYAKEMLEAAARTLDAAQVAAVAYAAIEVFPDQTEEIETYSAKLRAALSPFSVVSVENIIVRAENKPPEPAPTPEIRTADKPLKPAKAPFFLDLGDWTGTASATGLISSGNSRNATAGLRVEAQSPEDVFTHHIRGYFDYGRSQGAKNTQRWGGAYQLDYAFRENTSIFARGSYDEDAFDGFEYRLFAGFGASQWVVRNEKITLKFEGGPGYQLAPIALTDDDNSGIAFYGNSEFDWVLRDGLKFEQRNSVTATNPTTRFVTTNAVTIAFTDYLSTGFSYEYNYLVNPPEGAANATRIFRSNLSYQF